MLIFALMAAGFLAKRTSADFVYQESLDGDAPPIGLVTTLNSPIEPNVSLGILPSGQTSTIVGSVHGQNVDNVDIYEFTVATIWQADLTSYSTGNNNGSSAFRLHSSAASTLSSPLAGGQISSPTINLFSSANSPGTYRISIFESGSTSPATYSLDIRSIPEPITAAFIFSALALFVVRRNVCTNSKYGTGRFYMQLNKLFSQFYLQPANRSPMPDNWANARVRHSR